MKEFEPKQNEANEPDLFDEFEFKPLTEGLGFHKKAEQIKMQISDSRIGESVSGRVIPDRPAMMSEPAARPATPATDSMSKLMANLPPMRTSSLDFVEPSGSARTSTPISRTTKQVATELNRPIAATPAPVVSGHGFRQSEFQARLEESFSRAFPQTTVRKNKINAATATTHGTALTPIAGTVSSAIVDALTVVGISILCLVIILSITQVDLFGLLTNAQTDSITQVNLALLFISTLQLYMLVARSFFGMTLGEWAFDSQLGTPADQSKPLYPVRVVWRTLLATATAFVLPLISILANRDMLRPLTGLQLFSRADNDQESL